MNQALQIGPLSLPYSVLLTLVAIALGGFVANRLARAAGTAVEPTLTHMLLVGLVAARLAFVWQWREQYFDLPLSILDIRDGGWEPAAGVVVALLFGLQRAHRRAGLRKPVLAAALTTGMVLLLGGIATFLMAPTAAPLPPLTVSSLEGRPVSLAGFAGKPTVVNLWATWCPPCQREMPVLQQAQVANPDVSIVFVNQGEESPTIAAFLDRHGLALRNVLVDPQSRTGAALGHRALPTTLFFDAHGRLADTRIGELSQATLAQKLASLRAASPPTQRLDVTGTNLTTAGLAKVIAQPTPDAVWDRLDKSHWIADGRADAARTVYVFTDPNCPYCNKLWADARPWVDAGKVQLRHVVVGILTPTSAGKAAALLGDKNPAAALDAYERANVASIAKALASGRPKPLGDDRLKPLAVVPAALAAQLDANAALMASYGLRATPALVWKDHKGGVQMRQGAPESDLDAIFGPR